MTKGEYEREHEKLFHQYSVGLVTFDQMKERIRQLEDHAHEYQRNKTGEMTCWCGAAQ